MNLALIQNDIVWEDKPANFRRVLGLLERQPPAAGSLAILPEMFATGFSMNAEAVAEAYGGETEQFLAETARRFQINLMGGCAMRGKDRQCRNKALVFSPEGRLISYYAKMRPFSPGGEDQHYQAGEKQTVFSWQDCKVSPFICYDLRFPELFRQATRQWRPEIFCVIANFPEKRIGHWIKLLQARAIENQAFVAGVNRVGDDPSYHYNGHSLLVGPEGDIIADAGEGETVCQAKINLDGLRKYRAGLPFLDDLV
jgi:predicted amidohydrolase